MKKISGLIFLLVMIVFSSGAQPGGMGDPRARAVSDSLKMIDYNQMLGQLGITSIRQGASGTATAPNAANYDEAKANPYPILPDPLTLKNGKKVTTAKMWWEQRRPEIVEDFDREVYGRIPKVLPKVTWELVSTKDDKNGEFPIITKTLVGHVDNSAYPSVTVDIQLTLVIPANATSPVPVIMQFGNAPGAGGGFGGGPRPATAQSNAAGQPNAAAQTNAAPRPGPPPGPSWTQQVLAKGWAYAYINPASIQADNGGGLTKGIIGLVNKGNFRKPDDWGSLRALAWGADRAIDYFETDKAVNAKQVAIEGHSRWGKAALVTLAYDPRMAMAYVSSSGEGGAKLHRRNAGELVENVAASSEYHWVAGNFIKYAGPLTWNDLPVDSHELVAMCAPRPVFISAGSSNGDAWVDAKGMFLSAAGAGPVYKLLGKKDMGTSEFPPIETSLTDGDVAFRQHTSGHTDGPNWPTFLTFASRYFTPASKQ